MEDTDVLTAKEAAAYLRIDTLKLYRLARQGKIPAVKIGRRAGASAALSWKDTCEGKSTRKDDLIAASWLRHTKRLTFLELVNPQIIQV